MTAPIEQRYYTLKQAGEYLGNFTSEAVRSMARSGKIPFIKLGKRIIIDKQQLDAHLESLSNPRRGSRRKPC